MILLAERVRRDEQMDDPGLDPSVYERVLADLSRVNAWTLAARPTLGFLERATRGMSGFRLLDVGFGHGDMLRRIWSASTSIRRAPRRPEPQPPPTSPSIIAPATMPSFPGASISSSAASSPIT